MSKRQDYVQFPMRLSLAAYTFIQAQYQRKVSNTVSNIKKSHAWCPFYQVKEKNLKIVSKLRNEVTTWSI